MENRFPVFPFSVKSFKGFKILKRLVILYYYNMSNQEIDPRYQRGKIYKIVGSGMRYYGSTIQTLNARLKTHIGHYKLWLKGKHKHCKSFDIIAKGNYEIKLVRLYPCNNRPELDRKEGKYILKNECINKMVAGRTDQEYREQHRDKAKKYASVYREKKKDKIKKDKKDYYQRNKELIKDKIIIIKCSCGKSYKSNNKTNHEKTTFHKNNI